MIRHIYIYKIRPTIGVLNCLLIHFRNLAWNSYLCYRKRREESNDENLDIEMNVYKDISTYSPPNLSKYISVEVEKLLISKVSKSYSSKW